MVNVHNSLIINHIPYLLKTGVFLKKNFYDNKFDGDASGESQKETKEKFCKTLNLANVIYFKNNPINQSVKLRNNIPSSPLDLPFKTCFFETNDTLFTVPFNAVSGRHKLDVKLEVAAMLINEYVFNKYQFFLIGSMFEEESQSIANFRAGVFLFEEKYEKSLALECRELARRLLIKLNDKKIIVGNIKLNQKIRSKADNLNHVIRKIVVINDKKYDYDETFERPVAWSHKWEVRGHWRKINGLGKNRNDEYVIKNYTWVNPFIKGKGNLIIKNRIKMEGK